MAMGWAVNEHGERYYGWVPGKGNNSANDGWHTAAENPFNQMDYTRGGGGYDNAATHASNEARASAMTGISALPHFANAGVAQAVLPGGRIAVVGGNTIVKTAPRVTTGPGAPSASTNGGGGGAGAGSTAVGTAPVVRTSGAGSRLVISGPLKPVMSDQVTSLMAGGNVLPINRGWSNVDQFEERYGDSEFGSPTWFASWGVAGADMLQGFANSSAEYLDQHGLAPDFYEGRGGQAIQSGWDTLVNSWGAFTAPMASTRVDSNGVHWRTGGGF